MIKVFVATTETQGQRSSDFCWLPEGELVISASECDRDRDDIDGPCGCRRAMSGVDSRKATTTFKVVEWDGSREDWIKVVCESNEKAGYGYDTFGDEVLLQFAEKCEAGTVCEKRGDYIQIRS